MYSPVRLQHLNLDVRFSFREIREKFLVHRAGSTSVRVPYFLLLLILFQFILFFSICDFSE
ncbi:hypothetical protein BDZ91DRAFT_731060 [Kalaharituber pfeilii]|nr:hypothetical protein BDZ91DRAFT_731060 [Kalaharituber pfeilii]